MPAHGPRSAVGGACLAIALALAQTAAALGGHPVRLGATYAATVPATALAGSTISVPVTVQNTGDEIWNTAGPEPVLLAYHWDNEAGAILVWEGVRTGLGGDVPPGASRTVDAVVGIPERAGTYQLRFHLVTEGVEWFPQMSAASRVNVQSPYAVRFGSVPIFTYVAGRAHTLEVPLTNIGTAAWNAAGSAPIRLSYHWHDDAGRVLVWDGLRTALPADVPPGGSLTLSATVVAPLARTFAGPVTLTLDLVREGVAWFAALGGTPVSLSTTVEGERWSGRYDAPVSATARPGETRTMLVTVTNTGNVTWNAAAPGQVVVSYHVFDSAGRTLIWDGARTQLGGDLRPGESRTLTLTYIAPGAPGTYSVNTEAVREGIAWLSSYGSPPAATRLSVEP